jgi:hypothetical protein
MNHTSRKKVKYFWNRENLCLLAVLSIALLLLPAKIAVAANEGTEYFKMLSTVEYQGKGQFKNQVETLLTVRKQPLADDKMQYFLSTGDYDLIGDNQSFDKRSPKELSFIIDKRTKYLSTTDEETSLLARVNNECVKSLSKVTKNNVGRTWNQSFNMSFLHGLFPKEMKFTLTAIQQKTNAFGKMIAVRAMSDPFSIKITQKDGTTGSIQSRINSVYLFDPEVENIYMSISVFEATTNISGFKEKLRHEVATYKTNSNGVSVNLKGLDKNFEDLVRKVGLSRKSLKIDKEVLLPEWAQSEGLNVAQIANMCAAVACEGASNPVTAICIPAARTVAMQSMGKLASMGALAASGGTLSAISSSLSTSVAGVGTMKIAVAPAFMGVGAGTAAAVGGGGVAVAASSGGGSSNRSPSTP